MSQQIPVAVVGAGHMGRYHVQKYQNNAAARLVAVIDQDVEKAKALAEPTGAKFGNTLTPEMGDVAAATVAVPTAHHLTVAKPLIERGIHVLIEKPLASTVEDATELVELARKHDVLVQVGHTERFNPAVQAVERLGVRPKFIETHRISPFTFRSADVGVVFDIMIHDLDILLHLVRAEVVRVDAVGVNVLGPHEDIANARVVCANGAVANLTASRLALKTERKLRAFSESAYISLDYHRKSGTVITVDKNLDILKLAREKNVEDLSQMAGLDFGKMVHYEPLVIDDKDALGAEVDAFLECVRSRKTPPVSAEDGLAAVRLATDIVNAVRSHKWDGDAGERVGLDADFAFRLKK